MSATLAHVMRSKGLPLRAGIRKLLPKVEEHCPCFYVWFVQGQVPWACFL